MLINTFRADSRLAPNQWETSLQSNAVSHWQDANLELALPLTPGDAAMRQQLLQYRFYSAVLTSFEWNHMDYISLKLWSNTNIYSEKLLLNMSSAMNLWWFKLQSAEWTSHWYKWTLGMITAETSHECFWSQNIANYRMTSPRFKYFTQFLIPAKYDLRVWYVSTYC